MAPQKDAAAPSSKGSSGGLCVIGDCQNVVLTVRVKPPAPEMMVAVNVLNGPAVSICRESRPGSYSQVACVEYRVDHVIQPIQSATRDCELEKIVWDVMEDALREKTHGSVVTYGATGSGKTYTMFGSGASMGLVFHTLEKLFSNRQFGEENVDVSFVEVEGDVVRNLLDDKTDTFERTESGPEQHSAAMYRVASFEAATKLLTHGTNRRRADPITGSSKSHAVFQICSLKGNHKGTSKLSFVDIASTDNNMKGRPQSEATHIHQTLITLANCIQRNRPPLPRAWKDSKVTSLIRNSLQPPGHIVLLAAIHGDAPNADKSTKTLGFANRRRINGSSQIPRPTLSRPRSMSLGPPTTDPRVPHDRLQGKSVAAASLAPIGEGTKLVTIQNLQMVIRQQQTSIVSMAEDINRLRIIEHDKDQRILGLLRQLTEVSSLVPRIAGDEMSSERWDGSIPSSDDIDSPRLTSNWS